MTQAGTFMAHSRTLTYSSPAAKAQYFILMGLFRLAFERSLFGRFARGLGRIFSSRNAVYLSQNGEAPFKIYLNDGYWTRFALYHHDYEPEVERVLQAAAGHADMFCDLGANKGFWSVRAASQFDTVIAVEASDATFQFLAENTASLKSVTRMKKAIHEVSGKKLQFLNVPLSHASARIADAAEGADETVETVSIDDLVPAGTAALIKLDVEGAEIPAFDGAARALRDGAVFIYEDHGNDPECLPSAHLLRNPEIRLYSTLNTAINLSSVEEIRALKSDPFKGYNFMAAHKDSPLLNAILEGFAISKTNRYE